MRDQEKIMLTIERDEASQQRDAVVEQAERYIDQRNELRDQLDVTTAELAEVRRRAAAMEVMLSEIIASDEAAIAELTRLGIAPADGEWKVLAEKAKAILRDHAGALAAHDAARDAQIAALQAELAQAQARGAELIRDNADKTAFVLERHAFTDAEMAERDAHMKAEGAAEALERVANTNAIQAVNLLPGRFVVRCDDLMGEAAKRRAVAAKPRCAEDPIMEAIALELEEGRNAK